MGTPLYPKDLGTEWMKLRTGIKDAFTSANSRVPYQKIGAGILKVFQELEMQAGSVLKFLYSNSTTGVLIGRHVTGGGSDADGIFIQRPDGTIAFWIFSRTDDGGGFTAIYDQEENIIFSDDDASGRGIARPWIPILFAPSGELTSPPTIRQASTTSDTPVYTVYHPMQHPKIFYQGYMQSIAGGATAEIKFKNLTAGTTLHTATVSTGWVSGVFALDSDWGFGDMMQMDVTIRRASGTGNVGFTLLALEGRQS